MAPPPRWLPVLEPKESARWSEALSFWESLTWSSGSGCQSMGFSLFSKRLEGENFHLRRMLSRENVGSDSEQSAVKRQQDARPHGCNEGHGGGDRDDDDERLLANAEAAVAVVVVALV